MKILLCNDDGYRAQGINTLADVLARDGHTITIVAPNEERSGQSHAVSFTRPTMVRQLAERIYAVDGTPADCAIIGLLDILKNEPPDLVISGINHGLNVGWDVNYSGTVGAATEANMLGFRSIAVSVDLHRRSDVSNAFVLAAQYAAKVVSHAAELEWPRFEVLNLNHPGVEPKGIVVANCNNVNMYEPRISRLESPNLRRSSVYLIGDADTRIPSTREDQDVTYVQRDYATMSYIQSRQSSTMNNERLKKFLDFLK